jgi:hypothetical protein
MKAQAQKTPVMPSLVPKLFSAGTLRRAGSRQQPARVGRGVDSWLVFCLTRVGSVGWGRVK